MDKGSKILFIVWMVLAVASFVASFWAPIFFKVLGIVFGSLNLMIIGSWIWAVIEGNKTLKEKENELQLQEEDTTAA